MVLYSNWRKEVDGKMDGLRVIVQNWKEQSEKKKKVVLRNLVAAGYDIQTLTEDYRRSPSEVVFKNQLRERIQAMKDSCENYLLDTSFVHTNEVVRAVLFFMRDNKMR
jgi:RecA/RadA recombinase